MILLSQIDNYFDQLYKELDIPESYYEKANASYSSFNKWLERDESAVRKYRPEVFLQGSFKLGTVIKPVGENGSYDIDMVCRFDDISKENISQKQLKDLMGEEVLSYAESKGMVNKPKNGKRCWTLNYHDEAKFHMDILPCVNDSQSFINKLRLHEYEDATIHKEKAVAITDKDSPSYGEISDEWEISNPQGYYLWFSEKARFEEERSRLAKSFEMKVEDLKYYEVKTPLHRCIQILKRHRDIMFEENPDMKPSSIVITTLAAKAYDGSDSIKDVLKSIAEHMSDFIEKRNGEFYVVNPVNPLENFAEKWNEDGRKKAAYDNWIKVLKDSFVLYSEGLEIYDEDFSIGIAKQLGVSEGKARSFLSRTSVNRKIDLIPHRQRPQWSTNPQIPVYISATKTRKGFSLPKEFASGTLLSKNTDLKFEAKAENLREYEVYWQVTNTGKEARDNSCLRGDFYNGQIIEGKRIRTEQTRYTGTHLVECYLVKNGTCYGKSEPFIVNISDKLMLPW